MGSFHTLGVKACVSMLHAQIRTLLLLQGSDQQMTSYSPWKGKVQLHAPAGLCTSVPRSYVGGWDSLAVLAIALFHLHSQVHCS